ncbi:MAG: reverse transcriptase domain-containing protein, partial [Bacteroidota bacterium]|nr:reverse transcriptase domain-containing protein [Bacteroidota bacterium]
MNGRKQKTAITDTCQRKDRTESEGYVGGQTFLWMSEKEYADTKEHKRDLLEYILSPGNLNQAYRQVKANKGSGGVDGMQVEQLKSYLQAHREELIEDLQEGNYRPNPVKRVEIPKERGKKRRLGVPTVVDRVIQQAITQQLTPMYERQFSAASYGFRPRRSSHQALRRCQDYANAGYHYVVDMDLAKYFDTVNQSKLIEVLSRTIKDGRVVSLIHKYLRSGSMSR